MPTSDGKAQLNIHDLIRDINQIREWVVSYTGANKNRSEQTPETINYLKTYLKFVAKLIEKEGKDSAHQPILTHIHNALSVSLAVSEALSTPATRIYPYREVYGKSGLRIPEQHPIASFNIEDKPENSARINKYVKDELDLLARMARNNLQQIKEVGNVNGLEFSFLQSCSFYLTQSKKQLEHFKALTNLDADLQKKVTQAEGFIDAWFDAITEKIKFNKVVARGFDETDMGIIEELTDQLSIIDATLEGLLANTEWTSSSDDFFISEVPKPSLPILHRLVLDEQSDQEIMEETPTTFMDRVYGITTFGLGQSIKDLFNGDVSLTGIIGTLLLLVIVPVLLIVSAISAIASLFKSDEENTPDDPAQETPAQMYTKHDDKNKSTPASPASSPTAVPQPSGTLVAAPKGKIAPGN